MPTLHPALDPVAGLLGTWSGPGTGEYPTIEGFGYLEDLTFGHVGKPFLSMVQRTRDPETGAPLHAEAGYLRITGPGSVELVVAQPSGLVEVGTGTVGAGHLVVRSVVHATPSAKDVTAVERELRWGDEVLTYDLRMEAVGQPMLHHLSAVLTRAAG